MFKCTQAARRRQAPFLKFPEQAGQGLEDRFSWGKHRNVTGWDRAQRSSSEKLAALAPHNGHHLTEGLQEEPQHEPHAGGPSGRGGEAGGELPGRGSRGPWEDAGGRPGRAVLRRATPRGRRLGERPQATAAPALPGDSFASPHVARPPPRPALLRGSAASSLFPVLSRTCHSAASRCRALTGAAEGEAAEPQPTGGSRLPGPSAQAQTAVTAGWGRRTAVETRRRAGRRRRGASGRLHLRNSDALP